MLVIVSSANPVKLAATKEAFAEVFDEFEIASVSVASEVSEQPMSDTETRAGAKNRAFNAQQARPEADFWLGIEGGIEIVDDQFLASAWMVLVNQEQRIAFSRTPALPLPSRVKTLVESGLELGDANDAVFSTHNSKQAGGAYGLLSDGRFTRQGIYAQTIRIALIPFLHTLYADGASS